MAHISWSMKGAHLKNCNCAFGCPCDFNAPPTYGPCKGMAGMKIDTGHFGDVKLDGLCWAAVYHWPAALHLGNGTIQAIVDERADEHQRNALLTILSGQEQVEGTFFHILSMIVTNVLTPQFLPFEFSFDYDARTAHMSAPGIFETTSTPIKNPITGDPYRVSVNIPKGFEYELAEIASGDTKGTGEIKFDLAERHSSLALVNFTESGIVA